MQPAAVRQRNEQAKSRLVAGMQPQQQRSMALGAEHLLQQQQHGAVRGGGTAGASQPMQQLSLPTQPWQPAGGSSGAGPQLDAPAASDAGPSSSQVLHISRR